MVCLVGWCCSYASKILGGRQILAIEKMLRSADLFEIFPPIVELFFAKHLNHMSMRRLEVAWRLLEFKCFF